MFGVELGVVAEEGAGLVNAGEGMRDIADTDGTVSGLDIGNGWVKGGEVLAEHGKEGIEVGALAVGHIVDCIDGAGLVGQGRELIGLDHVVDIGIITGVAAVAIDHGAFVLHELHHEERYHRRVSAVGVLPAAEDIEVAQANGLGAIQIAEVRCVEFVDVLGNRVGRQRLANDVLDFGQRGAVAVGGAARRINKALDASFFRRPEHVHEARDIHVGGGHGVLNGARDGTQGGLVQYVVNAGGGASAGIAVADVADDQAEGLVLHEGQ